MMLTELCANPLGVVFHIGREVERVGKGTLEVQWMGGKQQDPGHVHQRYCDVGDWRRGAA
jgi:hypothetical protein